MRIFVIFLVTISAESCLKQDIATCQDCISNCLSDKIDRKKCKKLGFNSKKNKCIQKCDKDAVPTTCDQCAQIGKKCLKKAKKIDHCTGEFRASKLGHFKNSKSNHFLCHKSRYERQPIFETFWYNG